MATDEVTYRHTENGPSSCKPNEQPPEEEESYETTSRSSKIVVEEPGIGDKQPPTNGRKTSDHQCRLAAKQLSHWPCKQSSKDSPQGKECLQRIVEVHAFMWSVQCCLNGLFQKQLLHILVTEATPTYITDSEN